MHEPEQEKLSQVLCLLHIDISTKGGQYIIRLNIYLCNDIARCSVTMDMKIKLITKNTYKKDKDVRTHPCMITIKGVHNHPTDSASALQQLRVLPDTKNAYFKYFNIGKCT